MRTILVLVIAAVGIGLIIKRGSGPAAKEPQAAATVSAQATTPSQQSKPSQPSKHNWPKRSLDRAADVKRKVAAQRAEDGVR